MASDRDDDLGPHTIESDLTCKACHHQFKSTSLIGATFEAWVAWMEAQSCPNCGVAYVLEHARARRPQEYLHPDVVLPD